MIILYKETTDRLNSVPQRYKKFLNPKIYDPINKAYTAVITADEQNSRTESGRQRRMALLEFAIKTLLSMQNPIIAIWNIIEIKDESIIKWSELFNYEIALICGIIKKTREEVPMFVALPKQKIQRLAFLQTMSELHKYTYTKIGHAPDRCKDTLSNRISDFIDTALYEIVMANRKIPENRTEAEERESRIQASIDALNGLQRPLLSLWNIMDYSENVMDEWAGLLDKEIKLLEGLKAADKIRYKNLK